MPCIEGALQAAKELDVEVILVGDEAVLKRECARLGVTDPRIAIRHAPQLEAALEPLLDRKCAELSPIERAILFIAAWELENQIEVPYRVVINEAVELAKSYGGTDGFKYVNGVLDRLAAIKRPHETARRAG